MTLLLNNRVSFADMDKSGLIPLHPAFELRSYGRPSAECFADIDAVDKDEKNWELSRRVNWRPSWKTGHIVSVAIQELNNLQK